MSEFDAGNGTTSTMWGYLSDVLAENKIELPESMNNTIHALIDGLVCVTSKRLEQKLLERDARIKELEEALRRIMEDDITLSKCVAIAYKALSTTTPSKALQRALLEARLDALREVKGLEGWVVQRNIDDYCTELAALNKGE